MKSSSFDITRDLLVSEGGFSRWKTREGGKIKKDPKLELWCFDCLLCPLCRGIWTALVGGPPTRPLIRIAQLQTPADKFFEL